MEPDDLKFIEDYETTDTYDISWSNVTVSKVDDFVIDFNLTDSTFNIVPEDSNPEIYTSYEQREQHDKYPALKKAWEDYLTMFNLSKGEPPFVD